MNKSKNLFKTALPLIVAILVVILDQLSKLIVVNTMDLYESIKVIHGIINFTYVRNTGAAFSMFSDKTTILTIVTSALIVGCIYVVIKDLFKSVLVNWALVLCIGGGVGNMVDRIRLNYVVDFIECKLFEFPVFNVADIAITIGAGLLCLYLIKELLPTKKEIK